MKKALVWMTILALLCALVAVACACNKTPDEGNEDIDAPIEAEGITLDKQEVLAIRGSTFGLQHTLYPAAYAGGVTYTSDDPDVVQVSATGQCTAQGVGVATVTARLNDDYYAQCRVIVGDAIVESAQTALSQSPSGTDATAPQTQQNGEENGADMGTGNDAGDNGAGMGGDTNGQGNSTGDNGTGTNGSMDGQNNENSDDMGGNATDQTDTAGEGGDTTLDNPTGEGTDQNSGNTNGTDMGATDGTDTTDGQGNTNTDQNAGNATGDTMGDAGTNADDTEGNTGNATGDTTGTNDANSTDDYTSTAKRVEIVGATEGTTLFDSIQQALATLPVGKTIVVYSGNYGESISIAKNVTLVGVGNPTLRRVHILAGVSATLRNLTVQDTDYPEGGEAAILADTGSNITVKDCVIRTDSTDTPTGGYAILVQKQSAGVRIENNSLANFRYGIYVCPTSQTVNITDNRLSNMSVGIGLDLRQENAEADYPASGSIAGNEYNEVTKKTQFLHYGENYEGDYDFADNEEENASNGNSDAGGSGLLE